MTARNYYQDRDGYTVARYICENAPTDRVRPKAGLDGHGYERAAVGNAAGWRWWARLRSEHCPKCEGKMIPINEWVAPEVPND